MCFFIYPVPPKRKAKQGLKSTGLWNGDEKRRTDKADVDPSKELVQTERLWLFLLCSETKYWFVLLACRLNQWSTIAGITFSVCNSQPLTPTEYSCSPRMLSWKSRTGTLEGCHWNGQTVHCIVFNDRMYRYFSLFLFGNHYLVEEILLLMR